ncbi:MAG: oligosaccharide flippase family protein [Chloroflexota bacterium]
MSQDKSSREEMVSRFRNLLRRDDIAIQGVTMVVFSVISGVFMYLYQLAMGILLEPEAYGTLFSLTSLFYIVTISAQAVSTTVARFVSKLRAEDELENLGYLRRFFLKRALVIGLVTFALFTLGSSFIARFLNIDKPLYVVTLFSAMLFIFLFYANQGTFAGLQRFLPLGISLASESFFLMLVGASLVYLGLGIYGGLIAFPVSYMIALLVSFFWMRSLPGGESKELKIRGIGVYAGYVLLSVLGFNALTNLDAVLAKHYLTATQAGSYAAIAVLGRIALYAPVGVATAMFPQTATLFERGGNHSRVFMRALLLTSLISGAVVFGYVLFARLIVGILYNGKYPGVSGYLSTYALATMLFGLAHVAMRYLLSINQTKVAYLVLGALAFQLLLIRLFHATIGELVGDMLVTGVTTFGFLFLFSLAAGRKSIR